MKPSGTIFKNTPWASRKGEVLIALPFRTKVIYNYIFFLGTFSIFAAVLILLLSFIPIVQLETKYQLASAGVIKKPDYVLAANPEESNEVQKEASANGVNDEFSILIPKINAASIVIENVDPWNAVEYKEALTKGVAHAKESGLPGQGKSIFLFAHSTNAPINITRYNAVFYLLSKLEEGDEVVIYYSGKKHVYNVTDKVVTSPANTAFIQNNNDSEILYLMTCTPPGTTWNRLFIVAKPSTK